MKGIFLFIQNPTHDVFTVKINKGNYQFVRVINALGQTYNAEKLNSNEVNIDLSAAVPGIYFVILQGAEGSKIGKVEKL
ncbi:MAG TPA: T9SS type A sorting domain-containing protein [Flavipsychrobacter sp.]|nr:T9SS type A sorting domain-containing protein [Flavipsychrobacter sp.]